MSFMARGCALLFLYLITASGLAAVRLRFEVVPLSNSPSNVLASTRILRINNSNVVAGTMSVHEAMPRFESFLWQNGNLQILGEGILNDINDFGAYVGTAPGSVFQAEWARAINNAGQVIGEDPHPFLWDSNGFTYFPVGGVAGQRYARAVNNFGVAAGGAAGGGSYHAHIFTISNVVDIGMIPRTSISEGKAINDQGHVVLTATYTNRSVKRIRSYLYRDGVLTDLRALPGKPHTWAKAMNNSDEVVGFIGQTVRLPNAPDSVAVSELAGFLYSGGRLYDLNRLLTRASRGWRILHGMDINDSGSIAAIAMRPNTEPEPVLLRRVSP